MHLRVSHSMKYRSRHVCTYGPGSTRTMPWCPWANAPWPQVHVRTQPVSHTRKRTVSREHGLKHACLRRRQLHQAPLRLHTCSHVRLG